MKLPCRKRIERRSAVEKRERRQVLASVFAQSYYNASPQLVLHALQEPAMPMDMDIDHQTTDTTGTSCTIEPASARSRHAKTQVKPKLKLDMLINNNNYTRLLHP